MQGMEGKQVNGYELVKEESVTKNSRKVSGIKTTHIKNITIYRQNVPPKLIFYTFNICTY